MTALTLTNRLESYFALCKPKVVAMIVFTAVVGMLLATPVLVAPGLALATALGIGLAASSAAAINHVLDRRIDERMRRTRRRPLPQGVLNEVQALSFAFALGLASMLILVIFVNALTALLTFVSLIGYAVIYTAFLKHATPQNIVIGGAAGAAPPVLGWTAVTGTVDPHALLLFLIVFTWTPPHFWALAISRRAEYVDAGVPMLPVTHGDAFTRLHILFYTVLMILASLLPFATGMSGPVYLAGVVILDAAFLYYAILLQFNPRPELPMRTFAYSITYLMGVFMLLLGDHYVRAALAP